MPVVRTAGLSGGRSVYGYVITKFSRMARLLHFITHGAPLARVVRESSAKNGANWKIRLVRFLLRSRYENATPNLCWVFCALLGTCAINKGGFLEVAFVAVVDTHLPRFEALAYVLPHFDELTHVVIRASSSVC